MAKTKTTCRVESCSFHHPDDLCAAGQILVDFYGQSAVCDTFYPRNANSQGIQSSTMEGIILGADGLGVTMAATSPINESFAGKLEPVVTCSADDCRYWEQELCQARSITITGDMAAISGETRCKTYDPR